MASDARQFSPSIRKRFRGLYSSTPLSSGEGLLAKMARIRQSPDGELHPNAERALDRRSELSRASSRELRRAIFITPSPI